jgi:glycine hydroxymethyltransferase
VQQAWHSRLSDGRFYRGCEEGDRIELVAKHNIATAFSLLKGSPAASEIYVNVQALSGSPANLAIYAALLKLNDKILSLDLTHGGHLSHGSPYNVSGKHYKATHYGVDTSLPMNKRRLDYDRIRAQAKALKPRIIVGGASAYPWDWDWATLRNIADEVGALLHADVCHYAGSIVGGQLNNPLEHADVVMFTTHKTLMGPRGAAIVTKNAEIARRIDTAVFPGLQGGPHMNSIAGIAKLFEIIVTQRDDFCRLQ